MLSKSLGAGNCPSHGLSWTTLLWHSTIERTKDFESEDEIAFVQVPPAETVIQVPPAAMVIQEPLAAMVIQETPASPVQFATCSTAIARYLCFWLKVHVSIAISGCNISAAC